MNLKTILTAALHGALTGWASAAGVDYHAFTQWKSLDDAKTYAWSTALWRWLQGAVTGAVAGAGLGAFL
jgi:hypothetical protein